jgi:hypothetical protein
MNQDFFCKLHRLHSLIGPCFLANRHAIANFWHFVDDAVDSARRYHVNTTKTPKQAINYAHSPDPKRTPEGFCCDYQPDAQRAGFLKRPTY